MTTSNVLPAGASAADLLFADFANEHASTRRLLERYPDGQGAWRPHEKSRTLAQLATHVADITNRIVNILEDEELDIAARTPVAPIDSSSGLLAHFEEAVKRERSRIAEADFDHLSRPWTLKQGSAVLRTAPRAAMVRVMMSHLVHHRGQLGVYYRLLGVPVPGMYGPSADDVPPAR